jgi:DNA-binding GntR family transcriptional regulator
MRAVTELRYRIITGELGAGEQLRQEQMAELLDISRVPVREALRVLADQGLLEHRVHTGYFVKKRPAEELSQIFTMLSFLEARVMESLDSATPETIAELRKLNAEMAAIAPAADWAPMVDLNRRFHFAIFRLSPLKVILGELERLWTIAAPYIAQKFTIREMRERTVEEHDGLIDALEDGDFAELERRLDAHRSSRSTLY